RYKFRCALHFFLILLGLGCGGLWAESQVAGVIWLMFLFFRSSMVKDPFLVPPELKLKVKDSILRMVVESTGDLWLEQKAVG
ncbi:hypothetical protein AOLI_G00076590, partial [Acnodon oligacanthus]